MSWLGRIRERARARSRKKAEAKRQGLTVRTPEGLVLSLTLATPGQRFLTLLMDQFLLLLFLIFITIIYAYAGGGFFSSSPILLILFNLAVFFVRIFYATAMELAWNGRTLAKAMFGLRVISLEGKGLTTSQVVVRNLVREMEFFTPFYALLISLNSGMGLRGFLAIAMLIIVAVTIFRSRYNQRIGDYLSNTTVITDPKPVLLADMASSLSPAKGLQKAPTYFFTQAQLNHYGSHELHVLENVLRAPVSTNRQTIKRQLEDQSTIVEKICQRIGFTPIPVKPDEKLDFLKIFYAAQRDYLEQRQIMGDKRVDKFHNHQAQTNRSTS